MIGNTASSVNDNQFKAINEKLNGNIDFALIGYLTSKSKYIIGVLFSLSFIGCFFYLSKRMNNFIRKNIFFEQNLN